MRRCAVTMVWIALLAVFTGTTAHAQNVQGISLRAGEAMKGSPSGVVDIVGNGTSAMVAVDLSGAAETMKLADFEDAKAFVVWAVDMDGYRHNIGTLTDELKIADAAVEYRVARVYVTAEADAKATAPTGDPLYSVTLRNVTEKSGEPAGASKASSSSTTASTTASTSASTTSSTAASSAAKPAAVAGTKPSELPTTGGGMSDMMVLAAAALVLLGVGARLFGVRA